MSIRINSFSSAPVNNNINKTNKPKVAFGDGYTTACMDTLHNLQQRVTPEKLNYLKAYAQHIKPEDKNTLNQQLQVFMAQKNIKPVVAQIVDRLFGVKVQ